ncbi:nuclear transport factor 2 family protein (plasmid) [Phyllobacterium sp. 628]|uniref:nuclear transport factor 2 family protein n=1 Tax=Phyllobacterium sp. 628 TaxID=2718938 RepID=UPI001662232D|nr:nuclear transport factor 2 family protein [Phyllobacterium sp. 628]QND55117.1 nuclear transport factor 2 family protein [Phyllobacterium sp. 628]
MTIAFDTIDEAAVRDCEERLKLAMLASDVSALDALLADDLIIIDHQGRRVDKAQDIEVHRTGVLKLADIEFLDVAIKPLDNAALVSVRAKVSGAYYDEKFSEKLIYTRVWQRNGDSWIVVLAHFSRITM